MSSIIKRMLFNGYASMQIQIFDIVMCIVLTAVIGLYVYLVYKQVNKNSFYNKNFNMSLVAIAIITAAIILTIQSNIVVSLGMVGALSIVRFRTAIKDPMDLFFLFWSISIGIICGAGYAIIAIVASVVLTLVILYFVHIPEAKAPMVLIINSNSIDDEIDIMEVVKDYCSNYKVRARNLTKNHLDMAIEVRVNDQAKLVRALLDMENVYSASLVSHDGEVTV